MHLIVALMLFMGPVVAADPEQELIQIEQRLTDALLRLDVRTIDSLWSDDLVFVGLNGKPATKAERLSQMKVPPSPNDATVTASTNDDVKVRLYGQTAVVTLLATWKTKANDRESTDRYMTTHVWNKQRGQWRLVSAHVTRLAR
jgi:ketosteroid isomerase-like protein